MRLATELRSHVLFCAVLLVLFTNSVKPYSGKQTVRSSRQCAREDSFCRVQHLSASLRYFFQMWAVAVRFLNAKRSAQRHGFVGIAVRLTIGPLTSLVTYTAVVFLAGYLLTRGDVESTRAWRKAGLPVVPTPDPTRYHHGHHHSASGMQCRRAICQPDTLPQR